jgi:hypothetical protein
VLKGFAIYIFTYIWRNLKSPFAKVKLSLCLSRHHDMKRIRGVEVQLRAFLTSALGGGN